MLRVPTLRQLDLRTRSPPPPPNITNLWPLPSPSLHLKDFIKRGGGTVAIKKWEMNRRKAAFTYNFRRWKLLDY